MTFEPMPKTLTYAHCHGQGRGLVVPKPETTQVMSLIRTCCKTSEQGQLWHSENL
jgi:hypothetical protein